MNFKRIFSSWFGLGLLMFVLQYPFQYIFTLFNMPQMQTIALALAGSTAAMIFTYYLYPRIMSPFFKIYAMATTFCISTSIGLFIFLSDTALREEFSNMFQTMYQQTALRQIMVYGGVILFLLFQFCIWYFLIALGNKEMVKVLERTKK